MKVIRTLIILSLFIIVPFTGCEEEVLDKEPSTTYTEKDVWSDIKMAEKYALLNYNGAGAWSIQEEDGAKWKMVSTDIGMSRSDYGAYRFVDGTMSPSNMGYWSPIWSDGYNYIRRCNKVLENIDRIEDVAENRIERLKGEMRFLRAKIYFRLIKYFGGVPLVTEVFELDDDFTKSRDSYQDCVEFIVTELDDVAEILPETVSSEEIGRATKGAALGLKSSVLLHAASKLHDPGTDPNGPLFDYNNNNKWEDAANAAKAVMDMGLYSLKEIDTWQDYTKIFLEQNSEQIFIRPYTHQYGHQIDLRCSPNGYHGYGHNSPTHNFVQEFEMANGMMIDEEGSGYDSSPESIYENRELRFYANIVFNDCPAYRGRPAEFYLPGGLDSPDGPEAWNYCKTGYTMRKYMDESIDFHELRGNTPYIHQRLAEIYLNYAEAQYQLGNEDLAREYVNKIRNRVNLPDIETSGDELLEDIRHERKIELCFEGHRFFDTRRWMIADETAGKDAMGIEWKYVNEQGEIDPNGTLTYDIIVAQERMFQQKYYYLPIPYDEVARTGMKQNPGY